jgi:RNA polymerase sigma-70 factor (ECF subfamily)
MSHDAGDPGPAAAELAVVPGAGTDDGFDRDLVEAVLARDRKATAEFVARHADAVHGYVRRRLLPRVDLVDDLVQEVFIAGLEGLDRFAGTSPLRSWLLGIARHKVEDHYRDCLRSHAAPLDETTDLIPDVRIDHDAALDGSRRRERVEQVLADLPPAYRAVLRWRYWDHRSARDMAARTGRTEKAIERLLARARYEFKRRWSEPAVTAPAE